jgi:hypothetical protein
MRIDPLMALRDVLVLELPMATRMPDWKKLVLPAPQPSLDQLLRIAIEGRRLIRLRYRDRERIVEPHDYGTHNGSTKLLGYQVGGSSSGRLPNWRWMETALITDLHLLDQTFPGGRPTPSGKHHKWDTLFVRVKPADSRGAD